MGSKKTDKFIKTQKKLPNIKNENQLAKNHTFSSDSEDSNKMISMTKYVQKEPQ